MKIAVWHNLPSGGGKRALYGHLKGLLERGHSVECWCPSTADRTYLPLADLTTEHVRPVTWTDMPQRPLSHSLALARTVRAQLEVMDRHARQCAQEIETGGFDVLFVNSCRFFRVPAIARYTRLPAVLYLQEPFRPLYEALPRLPWVAPASGHRPSPGSIVASIMDHVRLRALRIQAREELLSARSFTSLLVNSLFSRESVLRAYGLESGVCYLGVDAKLFTDRQLPREPFVVGVGSFTREKRIDFVIDALGCLPPQRRRLVWIGNIVSVSYLAELRRRASSVGVTLDAREATTDAELVDVLNRATVMAYAPRLEPFGLAPLEANACGLPVVAVAEGGVRETVLHDRNGLLCEPTPQAMAAALTSLLDDPARARRLGDTGRSLVQERWSVDRAVSRLEDRLTQACEWRRVAAGNHGERSR